MITDKAIDQVFMELKPTCGGVRNDYFGLLYVESEHCIPRDEAIEKVAFGGNDYGIDGFHFDLQRRNLYLYQFKNSTSHAQFKESYARLINDGMARIFNASDQDKTSNQLLQQLRSCIAENASAIDKVVIHFVFLGDPKSAEDSPVLDKLREDLESKKYHIEHALGRPVPLLIEYKNAANKKKAGTSHVKKTFAYPLHLSDPISAEGPGKERLHVGFVRLIDLQAMFRDMGQRFFERNIRAGLPEEGAVNRVLEREFKKIVIDESAPVEVFQFNHNGVTISAEALKPADGEWRITEPRLLNGAQTVTTFSRFLEKFADNPRLVDNKDVLQNLRVLCRIVTGASQDFITTVTINNNRQNAVKPWNLRANDLIQLELQEKLGELGVYYERQEKAFDNLDDDDRDELRITQNRPVELYKLGQTFLAVDGELDKINRYKELFEDDKMYGLVFSDARLKCNFEKVVLCYKAERRLKQCIREITEMGQNKYEFVRLARNLVYALLCQGILNEKKLPEYCDMWGRTLTLGSDYAGWLSGIATTRIRFILKDLVDDKSFAAKVAEGNFNFLKTDGAYKRAMEIAYKRFKWVECSLK